jgi:transcriptional regulator with XRE-family HTH domain
MMVVATGDRIRKARTNHVPRLSQHALADKAGIKRSRLAQYEAGRTEPSLLVLNMLASALSVRASDLIDENGPEASSIPDAAGGLQRLRAEATGKIKIYGPISAGSGNVGQMDAYELDVPIQFAREDFAGMVIEGDSMEDALFSSDLCIFKDWNTYKPGGFVHAAQLETGEWVAKLALYENGRLILRSFNQKYPDIQDEFSLKGFLVGLVHDQGNERTIRLNPYGLRL